MKHQISTLLLCLAATMFSRAQTTAPANRESKPEVQTAALVAKESTTPAVKERIPKNAKLYVAPMGGYETFVVAGIMKKAVPVVIVNSRDKADYEITGASESQKAGWAKMFVFGSQQSHEEASIVVANIKTGTVVFGYNVNKGNS